MGAESRMEPDQGARCGHQGEILDGKCIACWRKERDQYREGWLSRGRMINGVGEFSGEGGWEPVKTRLAERDRLQCELDRTRASLREAIQAMERAAEDLKGRGRSRRARSLFLTLARVRPVTYPEEGETR